MSNDNKLYPEDQAKVDEFLSKGVNSVERKPFRPLHLLLILFVAVTSISVLSLWVAGIAGVG
ncbi:MAG: hypothetical protein ACJAYG_001811 [Oceanicoccus sp.]|jgi:hypothetical protein